MIHYNTYITQLRANGVPWAGPNIKANSFNEAGEFINKNGMGYLSIEGRLGFSFETHELN